MICRIRQLCETSIGVAEGQGERFHRPLRNDRRGLTRCSGCHALPRQDSTRPRRRRATVMGVGSEVAGDGRLTVKRLADAAGVRPDTVRYYEKVGLLPPPVRTAAGYRAYEPGMAERLHFIQGAQRLGLSLAEIRDLLAVRDTGACPCEPAAPLLRRHITELGADEDVNLGSAGPRVTA
jgi:DNA-binding transcriptional MerR regulator